MITRAFYLGGSHPPGYSLYIFIIKLFQLMPFGDIAARANSSGCFIMACNGLLLAEIILKFTSDKAITLLTSVCFAFFPLSVTANVAAEVYSLNMLFILLLVSLALKSTMVFKTSLLISFITGIAITHHLTFILFIPAFLFGFFDYGQESDRKLPHFVSKLLLFILGSSIWIVSPMREMVRPTQVWGRPNKIGGLISLLSAGEESKASFISGLSSFKAITDRSVAVLEQLPDTFSWPGLILALLGLIVIRKRNRKIFKFSVAYFLLLIIAVSLYDSNEAQTFFWPALFLCLVWFVTGIIFINEKIGSIRMLGSGIAQIFSIGVLLALMFSHIFPALEKRGGNVLTPRLLCRAVLDQMQENDLFVSRRSDLSFLLWYLLQVEHYSNAECIFQHLLSFRWYYEDIESNNPETISPEIAEMPFEDSWEWNRFITASLIQRNIRKSAIWISDPEIVTDISAAGFSQFNLSVESIFARLIPNSVVASTSNRQLNLIGDFDPLSLMVYGGIVHNQSRFYSIVQNHNDAAIYRQESERLYQLGRMRRWW